MFLTSTHAFGRSDQCYFFQARADALLYDLVDVVDLALTAAFLFFEKYHPWEGGEGTRLLTGDATNPNNLLLAQLFKLIKTTKTLFSFQPNHFFLFRWIIDK